MPQGAFLRKPAPGVASLVKQVKADPAVAIRYSRLFHLPVKMVPLAFEQLHLTTLKNDYIMQVHFVRAGTLQSGTIKGQQKKTQIKEDLVYKPRHVRAGTPVYCLPDGTPLLMRVCGNPIRTRVAPQFYTNTPVAEFDAGETLMPVVDTNISFDTQPRNAPLPAISLVPAEDVLTIAALPLAPALAPADMRAASLPPVYHWVHDNSGLYGGLAGLPLLGLLSAFGGGRGSALPAAGSGASGIGLPPLGNGSSSAATSGTTSPSSGLLPPGTASPETPALDAPSSGLLPPGTSAPGTGLLPSSPEQPIGSPIPVLPTTPTLPTMPISPGTPPLFSPTGGSPGSNSAVPEPGLMILGLITLLSAGWLSRKRRAIR